MLLTQKPKPPEASAIPRLDADPGYQTALAEVEALRVRSAETDRREQAARARLRGHTTTRNVAERAVDLLKGGIIPGVDPKAELAACAEENAVIGPTLAAAQARADEIASALGFEANQAMRSRHEQCLKDIFKAMGTMHSAITAALNIRAELADAGYQPRSDVLPLPVPHIAAALGSPDDYGTPAAWFGRELTKMGIF